jgi:hypothetical protein
MRGDGMIEIIKNKNGSEYYVLGHEYDYSLLKLKSDNYYQYVVVYLIHEVEDGIFEWQQGFYFNDNDIMGACDCFVKKCLPFDNPCSINATCQVCNIECRHRSDREE